MMKKTFFAVAFVAALSIASCNCPQKTNDKTNADMHTSENALDWVGSYYGVTPCATCPGIETQLTISADSNYVLTQKFIDEEGQEISTEGKFAWNEHIIELQVADKEAGAWAFKVEENQLRQLDLEGNVIEGDMASNYILTKTGNVNIEDKRWVLTEVNGKAVQGTADTHYIIFHSEGLRIEAKANCNMLLYSYIIKNQLQLTTTQGATTMMACPEGETTERDLIEAINTADNLSVTENSLTLNKGRMAPLAKFTLAE